MGFFPERPAQVSPVKGLSLEFLHRSECQACPLNHSPGLTNPKMRAAGSDTPLIYMLGEVPGERDDAIGKPLVGKAGRCLRFRIPKKWEPHLRWNNCVRTRTPDNRMPTNVELECCRPSIERDIMATKPKAIFGFGNLPLLWALKENGVTRWAGRRIPIKVGDHVCWFYPMLHPSTVLKSRKYAPQRPDEYGSDMEFTFALHLKQAFETFDDPVPIPHTLDDAERGVEFVTGANGQKDLDKVLEHLKAVAKEKACGLDYETNCLRPYFKHARILTVAVAGANKSLAFPLDHSAAKWTKEHLSEVDKALYKFLHEAKCRKVSHNLAFEMEWSAFFYGSEVLRAQPWADSMSQAYILDERRGSLSLDSLCLQYFGVHIKALSNMDRQKLDKMPLPEVLRYNAMDAKYHRLLYFEQVKALLVDGTMKVYQEHLRRIPTMVLTQLKGLPVDQTVVQKLHDKYAKRQKQVEEKLAELKISDKFRTMKGRDFSPGNVYDVGIVMRKILGLDPKKLDEASLAQIKHPVAKLIIQWRKAHKLLSTYVYPLMPASEHLFPDGMLHPVLATTRTRTWRTSSNDPNIQNFPKRETKEVRGQIVAPPGHSIVSFDFAGIQARNVAMESRDPALVKAFWDSYDIHADWVEHIAQIDPKWFKGDPKDKDNFKKHRHLAKNKFVFPSFFGAQPPSVSRALNISLEGATELRERFFDMFPEILSWHKSLEANYKKFGYVTGLSGFRRHAPVSQTELINAPIQADEALMVCNAMARLSEMEEEPYQASMEIHDDLTFIWPKKQIDKHAEVVITEMLRVEFDWINVPIGVEMSVGDNWHEMHEVGSYFSNTWRK